MKKILFSLLLFQTCLSLIFQESNDKKYSIEIWNSDFSMAYSTFYHVTQDSLIIKIIGELAGENERILTKRKLQPEESRLFLIFLAKTNLDTLKNEYINSTMSDGDQKKIAINVNGRMKRIHIANTYLPDVDSLFLLVNKIVPTDLKVSYKKK